MRATLVQDQQTCPDAEPAAQCEPDESRRVRHQRQWCRLHLPSRSFPMLASPQGLCARQRFRGQKWNTGCATRLSRTIGSLSGRNSPSSRFLRSEEHTSELQSLMRISYAVFCLKKKKHIQIENKKTQTRNT